MSRIVFFIKNLISGMDFNPATYDASKGPTLPAPPTAHCNAGVVRVDVTPEVGIHNR